MVGTRFNLHLRKQVWTFVGAIALSVLMIPTVHAQNLVANPGFESGTDDWFSFGPATFAISGGGHSGSACAGITVPGGSIPGIGQRMPAELQSGQTYTWSAWVRLSPTVPPPARSISLNLYYTFSATNYTRPIAVKTPTTTWAEVSATFELNVSGAVSNVMIGVDSFSPSTAFSFFLDDVSIINSSPTLQVESANNSVTLSWPATNTGYSLQRKSTLTSLSSWTTATDPLQTNGGVISATISPTNASRFYRLKK